MNSPLTPTQPGEPGHGSSAHPLTRLAAYAFLAQAVIFVAVAALLPMNTEFFEPHGSIAWPEFLNDLDAAPMQFLTIKGLMLALRTLYGISIVGVAVAWWAKNRSAAVLVVSFIIVSIPVINIAQLMGMALVPLADSYTAAASLGDSATMTSIEATASTTYLVAEYLDTFVNVVSFVGLLASLFWLSSKIDGLERIKWILPVLIVLPYNKFFDLPSVLQLGASLLNVVATGAYFFLMGWFMLKIQPHDPTDRQLPKPHQ